MDDTCSNHQEAENYYNHPSFNPNWLSFSLTPNPNPNPNPPLFHPHLPFFPTPPPQVNNFAHQQDGTGGPKLEDFLGGSGMYEGGPGEEGPTTAFYGTTSEGRRVEAVGGMDGLITAVEVDEEYKDIHIINNINNNKQQAIVVASEAAPPAPPATAKKTGDTFGHRTSIFRGVTRHRWTGRYEAHLWDNSCKREGQSRKGRQGGYDKEEKAARAYDLAALKYWGPTTTTNFPIMDYEKELEEMKHMTRQEFVASLRRKSSGFSRGASIYRGVTRHHQHGRWQARIGRVAGNKDLYLGTFSTQEEAAEAYDIAAIKFRGSNAVTNFDISRYDVKSIATSNLPVGGLSNKPSQSKPTTSTVASGAVPFQVTGLQDHFPSQSSSPTTLNFAAFPIAQPTSNASHMICWPNQERDLTSSNIEASSGSNLGFYGDQGGVGSEFAMESDDGSGGRGCVGPELHTYRDAAAKANLSALHTLIFGME